MEANRIFTRAEIKQRAKQSLKGRWGIAIGSIVLAFAIYYILNFVLGFIFGLIFHQAITTSSSYNVVQLISNIVSIITALITFPIFVGLYSIYIKISRNQFAKISDLFGQFSNALKFLGLYLLIYIKTFLWTLLFIIPGIIAAFRYSQAIYILIDNPEKSISQCIKESCEMMRGRKADLFVLSLSFLGWFLLTGITFGLAGLYVYPYYFTTYVNFYNQLADKVPVENFGASEEGFTIQEPATEAEVAQNEFVAPEPVVIQEPEVTSIPDVVTEPETSSEQEYGFEVEEDK